MAKPLKFLAKIVRFPAVSRQIQREAKTLRKLQDMRVTQVPEIVLNGLCDGRAFFVERFVVGVCLKGSNFLKAEELRMKLDWMKGFYSQTLGDAIEPRELILRAEEVHKLASEFTDLTEALAVLNNCKPNGKILTVCMHGDANDINFLSTRNRVVAIDFGFSKFNEPPGDPYTFIPPGTLSGHAKDLDVLSSLEGVNPLFLVIYTNTMHLDDHLRVQKELEENLLLVDRLREFPSRELGNIEALLQCYNESKDREK